MSQGNKGNVGNARIAAFRPPSRRVQRGSAVIEYAIVALLAIIVLMGTDEDVVRMVLEAIRTIYRAFTSAISMTYPPI